MHIYSSSDRVQQTEYDHETTQKPDLTTSFDFYRAKPHNDALISKACEIFTLQNLQFAKKIGCAKPCLLNRTIEWINNHGYNNNILQQRDEFF